MDKALPTLALPVSLKTGLSGRRRDGKTRKSGEILNNFAFLYYFYDYYGSNMNLSIPSDGPIPSRILGLVRAHHGLPEPVSADSSAAKRQKSRWSPRCWNRESRRNHLTASRRRMELDAIPRESFPVILELSGGSNFVIVNERITGIRNEGTAYLVQFPDSRESLVRADRLREIYDGTCVLLRPAPVSRWNLLRRRSVRAVGNDRVGNDRAGNDRVALPR